MMNSMKPILLGEYAFVDRYGRHLEAYVNYGPVKNIKNIPKVAQTILDEDSRNRQHIRFKVYEYTVATGSHLILDWADIPLETL